MSVRLRLQVCIAALAAALVVGVLSAISPVLATAEASTAPAARVAAKVSAAAANAGEKAGKKAGATAGEKAGRKAGAKRGKKAAAAAAKAGRKAGAAAGAKAGRRTGGSKAGGKAGAKAGAKAGKKVGLRVAEGVAYDCGGATYLKADGSPWECTFGDDFDGTKLDTSKWRVMTSDKFSYGNNRPDCFVDDPDNVSVGEGVLRLTARKESAPFTCIRKGKKYSVQYSSGLVSTYEKFVQARGRFEFRARLPHTTQDGLQTSMWLWPDGENGATWPASGEIDVAEWYSHFDDRVIPYLHHSTAAMAKSQATNNNCLVDRVQDWHTYLLDWTPSAITISYDGKVCLRNTTTTGKPFDKPYMISMFQAFGLGKNKPTAKTPTPATAEFAWVRVWK